MTGHCKHDGCYPDTTCALGHIDRTNCENWITDQKDTTKLEVQSDSSDIPWNIYALGTNDLSILAGRGRPIVVGLIGAPGSGKTTLLAFLYMWLLEHGVVSGWMFCGSWTLGMGVDCKVLQVVCRTSSIVSPSHNKQWKSTGPAPFIVTK